MSKPGILHMVTPDRNISPFDVNMAIDAGYQSVVPYTNVSVSEIGNLVQDAIFSRPPKSASSTGFFIGGNDVNIAAEMLQVAKQAMVGPFEVSILADPNGAYTTAGALIAVIEKVLENRIGSDLQNRSVKVFGGGPVGLCATILALSKSANTKLVRLTSKASSDAVSKFATRYKAEVESENAVTNDERAQVVADAEVIICTAKAGVQVLDNNVLANASSLIVAADVNAVPPAGIECVNVTDNCVETELAGRKIISLGALGVGKVKYDTQLNAFKKMLESKDSLVLDFHDVHAMAKEFV